MQKERFSVIGLQKRSRLTFFTANGCAPILGAQPLFFTLWRNPIRFRQIKNAIKPVKLLL